MTDEYIKARDEYIAGCDFLTPIEMCLHAEKSVIVCHNESVFQQGADWCKKEYVDPLQAQVAELQKDLEVAREALEFIRDNNLHGYANTRRFCENSLEKIGAKDE